MKKTLLALLGLLFACPIVKAQVSKGGKPYSYTANLTQNIRTKTVPALSLGNLRKEDALHEKQGLPLRIGVIFPVSYSLNNAGTWTTLPDGDRIWRLKIDVQGALATSLYYQDFHLPEGATLFVYNEDHTQLIGSYTSANNHEAGLFATEILKGNVSILEYYEPRAVKGQGRFTINGVNNIYSDKIPESKTMKTVGASGSCNVNVNCPEGAGWQNQKRAVARIVLRLGGSSYLCTGAVVNNARSDCKPYFLTANHCGSDASAADFNQWIFYFNYEAPSCSNPAGEPTSNTITGCVQRARSGDGGEAEGSDFQLLEFNQSIPSSYNVFYSGWSAAAAASPNGVSIHHPAGDIKKISTYTAPLTNDNFNGGGTPYTHWRAVWVQTQTNWSVTEGGSSGSPLFNNVGQIVGQLSGGPSSCTAANTSKYDQYGKVSWSWTSNGTDALHQLKPWLDPDNTGILQINGTDYPCGDTTPPTVCTDQLEPNNTQATAAGIATGTSIRSQISTATDVDYYRFTTTGTNNLTIRLDSLPADFDVKLFSSTGSQLAISQNGSTNAELITYNNAAAGTYYVQVYGYSSAFSNTKCYRLSTALTPVTTCTDAYEPNGSMSAAATISTNTFITAQIATSTDKDWYRFTNSSSQPHIELLLNNLAGDYDLILYNASGTELSRSENGDTTAERIVLNNAAVGTYYIQVYGYNGAFSTTKCYRLVAGISSTPKQAAASKSSKVGNSGMHVYPVPARDKIYTALTSGSNQLQYIIITDLSGKVVYKAQHKLITGYNRLEILLPASLKDGVYIISDGKHSKKFVIQR